MECSICLERGSPRDPVCPGCIQIACDALKTSRSPNAPPGPYVHVPQAEYDELRLTLAAQATELHELRSRPDAPPNQDQYREAHEHYHRQMSKRYPESWEPSWSELDEDERDCWRAGFEEYERLRANRSDKATPPVPRNRNFTRMARALLVGGEVTKDERKLSDFLFMVYNFGRDDLLDFQAAEAASSPETASGSDALVARGYAEWDALLRIAKAASDAYRFVAKHHPHNRTGTGCDECRMLNELQEAMRAWGELPEVRPVRRERATQQTSEDTDGCRRPFDSGTGEGGPNVTPSQSASTPLADRSPASAPFGGGMHHVIAEDKAAALLAAEPNACDPGEQAHVLAFWRDYWDGEEPIPGGDDEGVAHVLRLIRNVRREAIEACAKVADQQIAYWRKAPQTDIHRGCLWEAEFMANHIRALHRLPAEHGAGKAQAHHFCRCGHVLASHDTEGAMCRYRAHCGCYEFCAAPRTSQAGEKP